MEDRDRIQHDGRTFIGIMCCPAKDVAGMKFLCGLCYDEATKELYFHAQSLRRTHHKASVKVVAENGNPVVYERENCDMGFCQTILNKYASEFARTVISLENFKDAQYREFFRP